MSVISDVEIPDHDVTTLRLAMATAAHRSIKQGAILGDLLASDAFAHWPVINKRIPDSLYADEAMLGVDLVMAMFVLFDEIFIIDGNHDRRANKKTDGELSLKFLMDLAFRHLSAVVIFEKNRGIPIGTKRNAAIYHPWDHRTRTLTSPVEQGGLSPPLVRRKHSPPAGH